MADFSFLNFFFCFKANQPLKVQVDTGADKIPLKLSTQESVCPVDIDKSTGCHNNYNLISQTVQESLEGDFYLTCMPQ